jgi:pimeloyl-ACP methyl ester carboxylesterase
VTFVVILAAVAAGYLLFTLLCTYLVQALPRRPIEDPPDWGRVTDTRVTDAEGGSLEVWRVEPDTPSKGIVLLAHGWGRNRDRMVHRARMFGQWGFTTVIHSARDHGSSSRRRFMNAYRFAEDIETIMNWIGEPVILYGHSAGAGGAIIAASRNPGRIRLLMLEACYAVTDEALLSLYRWVNWFFGTFIGPMVIFWMKVFYRNRLKDVDPVALAPQVKAPTLIIHGENDRRFPVEFARRLHASFPEGQAQLHIARGVGHSDSSQTEAYPGAVKAFLDRHL